MCEVICTYVVGVGDILSLLVQRKYDGCFIYVTDDCVLRYFHQQFSRYHRHQQLGDVCLMHDLLGECQWHVSAAVGRCAWQCLVRTI